MIKTVIVTNNSTGLELAHADMPEEDVDIYVEHHGELERIWGDVDTYTVLVAGQLKTKIMILNDIYSHISSPEQYMRLVATLDVKSTFVIALDDYNYPLAHQAMSSALYEGLIMQEDYDMIVSHVPEV